MDSGRVEAVPNGTGHLDTVRALHQTVVSLRTALEVSKNELKELKEKYQKHSLCLDYTDVIEKLTIENHILRRKIIDSGYEDQDLNTQNIKLQVTYSPRQNVDVFEESEVVIKTATTDVHGPISEIEDENVELDIVKEDGNICSIDLNESVNDIDTKSESPGTNENCELSPNIYDSENIQENTKDQEDPNSNIISFCQFKEHKPVFKTKLELLSKFDVRIKVRTLKEGTIISSTTSESDSTFDERKYNNKESTDSAASYHFEEKREHFQTAEDFKGSKVNLRTVSSESIKMAVPNDGDVKTKPDKFDVHVKITSEENLILKETAERNRRKDTLNLDVDDLSLRSLSEGDNSVFSEGVTPVDPCSAQGNKDDISENDSEEVDDIELIFTTDESKDMSNLQEDLVSIRESDQWAPPASAQSTPVLIKFHTLDPDFQPGADSEDQPTSPSVTDSSLKMKRVSLPNVKEIRHVAFYGKGSLDLPGRGILKSYDNKSDNTLFRRSPNVSTRRLDSVDSLSCEYRGLSFDNTKSSSFELGSSLDVLQREESVDSFHKFGHFGHRFSVFAETDISKCGISEEDLSGNLHNRRNTCPNPFQYRLPIVRGGRSIRPVLRESTSRRSDGAAQTDVTAIPPQSVSDQYLASYKVNKVMSVPSTRPPLRRGAGGGAHRRATVAPSADTKRLLLSDIGFTSMVPELSRSADPLWRAQRQAQEPAASVHHSASTAKYMSRGSSYRSPFVSIDRSSDHIPQSCLNFNRDTRCWRSSLPDVRRDDTDELLEEAEVFVRRSIDNLHSSSLELDRQIPLTGTPYIPSEPRQLRLGHTVKVITPQGRIAVGRVRYVGLAGGQSEVLVGVELPGRGGDGGQRARRYFRAAPHCTALFLPFNKVVMAWAN